MEVIVSATCRESGKGPCSLSLRSRKSGLANQSGSSTRSSACISSTSLIRSLRAVQTHVAESWRIVQGRSRRSRVRFARVPLNQPHKVSREGQPELASIDEGKAARAAARAVL